MAEEKGKHGLWWWADRYRKSTAYTDMTLAEQGAYRNLLDEQRLRGGFLPNDERILGKACGDALEWPTVRAAVLARFETTDDGKLLFNRTAAEVNAESDRLSAAASVGGKVRAEKAARVSGRFTSGTSGSTSDQTSGEASDDTSDSPAETPASVSVAVSVSGSVTGERPTDTGLPAGAGEPPPTSATPAEATALALRRLGPKPERATWLTPFGDTWRARWGAESEPPWGELAQQLSKPAKELDRDDLLERWGRFLTAAATSRWARPARFVQGLGEWVERPTPGARKLPVSAEQRWYDANPGWMAQAMPLVELAPTREAARAAVGTWAKGCGAPGQAVLLLMQRWHPGIDVSKVGRPMPAIAKEKA